MRVVIVVDEDRVAIRVVAACMAPIERGAAHDECEQRGECSMQNVLTDHAERQHCLRL